MERIPTILRQAEALFEGHPLLLALTLVVLSLLAAWIADVIISRGLASWARRSATQLDDRLIAAIHRPIFISVVLLGAWGAIRVLELAPGARGFFVSVLASVAILVWAVFLFRAGAILLDAVSQVEGRFSLVEPRTQTLLENALKLVLGGGAVYFVLLAWSVDVSGLLVGAGVVGLVVGLAAKDTLANIFSGIFILADVPYKVGDFINLDSGERGQVSQIGLRSTRLVTRDDVEVTLPNAVIANAKIVNESGGPWEKERVRVKVGVAYGSDADEVRRVLLEVAGGESRLSREPAPRVRLRGFGDSSLDFELLAWIDEPVLRGRVLDALYTEIYKRFGAAGIEIPYPKRDVYLHPAPGAPPTPPAQGK